LIIGAVILGMVVIIVVVLRKRRAFVDRNLHLSSAFPEGASVAYIPEYAEAEYPMILPRASSSPAPKDILNPSVSATQKRIWKTSAMALPPVLFKPSFKKGPEALEDDSIDEYEAIKIDENDFALEEDKVIKELEMSLVIRSLTCNSTVLTELGPPATFIMSAWNEEEAREEAQLRRKEQRDVAWAQKRTEKAIKDIQDKLLADESAFTRQKILMLRKEIEELQFVEESRFTLQKIVQVKEQMTHLDESILDDDVSLARGVGRYLLSSESRDDEPAFGFGTRLTLEDDDTEADIGNLGWNISSTDLIEDDYHAGYVSIADYTELKRPAADESLSDQDEDDFVFSFDVNDV
jgi:hypothetical protein